MTDYRNAMLSALAPDREPVPDSPGVFVARLTAAGWRDLTTWQQANPGRRDYLAVKLVALAVTDAAGEAILSEADVGSLPADVFDRIGRRAAALNGNGKGPTPPAGPVVKIDGPPPLAGLIEFSAGRVPVLLRRLTEADRRTFQREFGRDRNDWRAAVWAAARSIVDPRGGRVLCEASLWAADGCAVDAIVRRVARLNGFN